MTSALILIGLLFAPLAHAQTYTVKVTSYNNSPAQTDHSPCIGAASVNLCTRVKEGGRVIALSQDLVGRSPKKPFRYHDVVRLHPATPPVGGLLNPACSGEFIVLDTMNARLKNRADIFFLDRKQNTSCTATITKIGNALKK